MKPLSTELTDAEKLKKLEAFVSDISCWDLHGEQIDGETYHADPENEREELAAAVHQARELRDLCGRFDTVTYTLPAAWASYIINGDASGLDPGDQEAVDAFFEKEGDPNIVDCGESFFSKHNDATNEAADVCEYSALVERAPAPTARTDERITQ